MKTGFFYHPDFLAHDTGPMHPERPERLSHLLETLQATELWGQLRQYAPAPADPAWLARVHTPAHIERIRQACQRGPGELDPDTPVCPASWGAALRAVGAGLEACDRVMSGELHNAFCAVRPPGHHAESNRAMGFCLFNNVAVAARYLQVKHGIRKVLIVDFDVHHGNGTQEIFYSDPTVLYFSVHQYPLFPGTGAMEETGAGPGKGLTINVPLGAGAGDFPFMDAFDLELAPNVNRFMPEFILVSAGFDAHIGDPLAGMRLTDSGFSAITQTIKGLAKQCCQGRIVSFLEGGYNLRALASSVQAHLQVLQSDL